MPTPNTRAMMLPMECMTMGMTSRSPSRIPLGARSSLENPTNEYVFVPSAMHECPWLTRLHAAELPQTRRCTSLVPTMRHHPYVLAYRLVRD